MPGVWTFLSQKEGEGENFGAYITLFGENGVGPPYIYLLLAYLSSSQFKIRYFKDSKLSIFLFS